MLQSEIAEFSLVTLSKQSKYVFKKYPRLSKAYNATGKEISQLSGEEAFADLQATSVLEERTDT